MLEAVAAAPERRIWELPVIDEDEQRQLLQDWNRTEAEYPREKSIPELFVEQVERTPEPSRLSTEQKNLPTGS